MVLFRFLLHLHRSPPPPTRPPHPQYQRGVKDVKVKDIYACPNFEAWIDGYIDSELSRFEKEEWTQLQISFERVEDEFQRGRYPLLVKTTYRAYSQHDVLEIVDDPDMLYH